MVCTDSSCEVEGGRKFFFSEKEQKNYKEQGWPPPKRCFYCREAKRKLRERQENSKFTPILEDMKKGDRDLLK